MPSQGFHNINALPFRACNIVAHAAVTVLVYYLAQQLAAARDRGSTNVRIKTEAFIAAMLFAVHPVHTEAVAGVVGQAELLCAIFSISALLCYMAAANSGTTRLWSHWSYVAAALLLGCAAVLTKEIGITIVSSVLNFNCATLQFVAHFPIFPPNLQFGSMICYDALVAPLAPVQVHGKKRHKLARTIPNRLNIKLARMFAAGASVLVYVKARSLLAGHQVHGLHKSGVALHQGP